MQTPLNTVCLLEFSPDLNTNSKSNRRQTVNRKQLVLCIQTMKNTARADMVRRFRK